MSWLYSVSSVRENCRMAILLFFPGHPREVNCQHVTPARFVRDHETERVASQDPTVIPTWSGKELGGETMGQHSSNANIRGIYSDYRGQVWD